MGEPAQSRLWSASTLVEGMELVDAHASSRETHEPTEQEMKEELAVSWLNVLMFHEINTTNNNTIYIYYIESALRFWNVGWRSRMRERLPRLPGPATNLCRGCLMGSPPTLTLPLMVLLSLLNLVVVIRMWK